MKILKMMHLITIAFLCIAMFSSCGPDNENLEENNRSKELTINATYNGNALIGWSDNSQISVYSYAKSSNSSQFKATTSDVNSCSFDGYLNIQKNDIIYAVYPALSSASLPSQIPFDLSVQDETTKSIFAATKLYEDEDNVSLEFENQLVTLNFKMRLNKSIDLSRLDHILLISNDFYSKRYLNLTNGKPFWNGGEKNAILNLEINGKTTLPVDDSDDVMFTFKVLAFPSTLSDLTIRLNTENDMTIYSRTLSEIDYSMQAGDVIDIPELEYIPGNPYSDTSIEGVINNGELFE